MLNGHAYVDQRYEQLLLFPQVLGAVLTGFGEYFTIFLISNNFATGPEVYAYTVVMLIVGLVILKISVPRLV